MKWVSPFFSESPTAIKESLIKNGGKIQKFIDLFLTIKFKDIIEIR